MGLLKDTYGQNQWLDSARAQVFRLDRMIKNLVELARTEERIQEDVVCRLSVIEIAQAGVDAFQPAAEADGKTLTAEIAPDICLRGIQDNLFRLFTILLDNGVKYCDPGGDIRCTLSRRGRSIYITVSNPCAGLDAALRRTLTLIPIVSKSASLDGTSVHNDTPASPCEIKVFGDR